MRLALFATAGLVLLILPGGPAAAAGPESITSPDTAGTVGYGSSLQLDASGNPVISYYDAANDDLKVMHCNDPDCAGGNESITTPDTAGDVGQLTSLQLDVSGNPVVAYYDAAVGSLKILHCNDPNCAPGGDSITVPDIIGSITGSFGLQLSLALDAAGNPVVSYQDWIAADLKVLHCDDPNCAFGGDSITSPDVVGNVGHHSSLALDASGNPVVSYHDNTNGDLKLLHCNDPNCALGGDSITSPATAGTTGLHTSLALDGSGNPVVAYATYFGTSLHILHCNDANCAPGGDSMTTPSPAHHRLVERKPISLALDNLGYPVVAYTDSGGGQDLYFLRCNDANCAPDGDTFAVLDAAGNTGVTPSLALDASGYPVVSYGDGTNGDLKVLHCNDPNCDAGAKGVGGLTELPSLEQSGRPFGPFLALGAAAAVVPALAAAWYARSRVRRRY